MSDLLGFHRVVSIQNPFDMLRPVSEADALKAGITMAKLVHGKMKPFYGTEDTRKIDAYLVSLGYTPQGKCNIDNMCWRGTDNTETVVVRPLKSEKGSSTDRI